MGITKNCVKFLAYAQREGVSFDKTLMLGRQQMFVTTTEIQEVFKLFGKTLDEKFQVKFGDYSEPFFKQLGNAKVIDSMDISTFENASVIHDMNKLLPDQLFENYSVVFDGGTLEHVFNFPVAIKNCMNALMVGGHFIGICPTNNQCGHGFYQFSPELFYSLFNESTGFKMIRVLIGSEESDGRIQKWYEVENPDNVKNRVTLSGDRPAYLMVLAEKESKKNLESIYPMQSDYAHIWQVFDSMQNETPSDQSKLLFLYRKYFPEPLKKLIRKVIRAKHSNQEEIRHLGRVNPLYFKEFKI